MTDLVAIVLIAGVAAVIGVGFGIVVVAPRIGRLLDRADSHDMDEERGDRPA